MTVWRIEICQYLLLKLELYVKLMWYVKKGNFISIISWLTLTGMFFFKFALKPTIIKRPA